MTLADTITYSLLVGAGLALVAIIWSYAKGLRKSPRDLWLLFTYKFVEYAAYAATNMAVILWLSADCGLGDIAAGSFISGWSIFLSIVGMIAGALVDTIGIRKTMIISVAFLIFSRLVLVFCTDPWLVFIFAFIPLAVGFAIVAPLISVAIKRYTTKEGAALGFGLFYVIMNMGYAAGGKFFDWIRGFFATRDEAGKIISENAGTDLFGHHFSTYQMIFLFGLGATCVSLWISLFIREGVEMTDDGVVIRPEEPKGRALDAVRRQTAATCRMIFETVRERFFWVYMGLLSLTLFVRFVFFHFHYTFPKYGIRVLGEGAQIGSVYGVLNPALIVFLVPLVAWFTKKTSSYKMMIWGSAVSSLACFIAVMPASWFVGLTGSVLGELVFVNWLGMAPDLATLMQAPPPSEYWPLVIFITIFTIGEAIWSPRLMQFTAEIAPKGKEGTYIALSVLPFFVAKFFVGPMSGWLVSTYTPVDADGHAFASYPDHHMVWVWIGGVAVLSPIGLLVFRRWFLENTAHHEPH
jgi:POT family proton-dependent oligopeptide transporter